MLRSAIRPLMGMALLALLIAGCAVAAPRAAPPSHTQAPPTALFPYTVVDSNGATITFDKPPERIVAFDSAAVEILFAIGEGDRVVGTHDFVSYPPEAEDVPRLGDAFGMNIEKVVALEPDLVFIFVDTFLQDLQNAGLKVFYLANLKDDFNQVADRIRMWGRITGSPDAAEAVAADFESHVKEIQVSMETIATGPSIFQDTGDFWTPGPDTLVGRVFDLLKLQNIAHDVAGYTQLSPEVFVERDPDIIITVSPDSIVDNPAFKDVSAVSKGRVYGVTPDLFAVAGPRFVDDIETLARLAYPDIFD